MGANFEVTNGISTIRRAVETSRAVVAIIPEENKIVRVEIVAKAQPMPDENAMALAEGHQEQDANSEEDEEPLANLVVNGHMEPQGAQAHVATEGDPVACGLIFEQALDAVASGICVIDETLQEHKGG